MLPLSILGSSLSLVVLLLLELHGLSFVSLESNGNDVLVIDSQGFSQVGNSLSLDVEVLVLPVENDVKVALILETSQEHPQMEVGDSLKLENRKDR